MLDSCLCLSMKKQRKMKELMDMWVYMEAEQSKTDRHCVIPLIPREERRKLYNIQQIGLDARLTVK